MPLPTSAAESMHDCPEFNAPNMLEVKAQPLVLPPTTSKLVVFVTVFDPVMARLPASVIVAL